jgi:hypothetical protein
MEEHNNSNPEFSIQRIRLRNGKVWAKTRSLAEADRKQRNRRKAQNEGGNNAITHPSIISFCGAPRVTPTHSIVHVMSKISVLLGTPLTQVPPNQVIPTDEQCYQIQYDFDGHWSRKIFVWLGDSSAHKNMFRKVHGCSLSMHDEVLVVEISNDHLDLDASECSNIVYNSINHIPMSPNVSDVPTPTRAVGTYAVGGVAAPYRRSRGA